MNNKSKTLIGLNLAVFMMMLGVGMIMSLLPQRIINLTGTGATVGYLASAFAISYIILQVPIGNLSDRLGFKLFLVCGYFLCALTGLLYYFADQPNLFFFGRILQGAGEAPVWALAPALLSISYAKSKGKIIGIYNASIHAGLTLGPILGIILGQIWKENQPFLFYGITCLVGALVVLFLVDNVKNEEAAESQSINFKNILLLITAKKSLIALVGIALYGAGYGMLLTNIPAFLIRSKNFSQFYVSLFFALFYIAISISQLITGELSDHMGRRRFMISGLVLASISLFLFPYFDQPWISIILTLGSLGLGAFYLSSMAYLNEVVPNSLKGTITGAYYLFWGIGFFFGPILMSGLSEQESSAMSFQLFSGLLLVEAIVMVLGIERKKTTDSLRIS